MEIGYLPSSSIASGSTTVDLGSRGTNTYLIAEIIEIRKAVVGVI